jgi:hypothetical protein
MAKAESVVSPLTNVPDTRSSVLANRDPSQWKHPKSDAFSVEVVLLIVVLYVYVLIVLYILILNVLLMELLETRPISAECNITCKAHIIRVLWSGIMPGIQ